MADTVLVERASMIAASGINLNKTSNTWYLEMQEMKRLLHNTIRNLQARNDSEAAEAAKEKMKAMRLLGRAGDDAVFCPVDSVFREGMTYLTSKKSHRHWMKASRNKYRSRDWRKRIRIYPLLTGKHKRNPRKPRKGAPRKRASIEILLVPNGLQNSAFAEA